jgi:site-specific DNA recombinase
MTETLHEGLKLIATYSRVSTSRQEEEGTIETQLSVLREFAEKQGYTIVKEYIDEGWSGDVLERPNLDEMRQDAKSKLWEAVLIYDPDRLARRYSYQELLMDELKEAGIEIMFITIAAPKNSEEKILHGVRGLFAEYERAKIAERFRLGKLRKIKEGHILVSQPLYGYSYVLKQGNQAGYYVINEAEARVVRMMFAWIADEGMTIRDVIRKLQELAIKPRKSVRGVWSTSTLTTMLRNKAYIGEAHWRSSIAVVPKNPINKEKYRKTKKSSRIARPKEEWLTVPVPVIIERELFERAEARLKANETLCPRNKKYEYLLGSRVECICGVKRVGAGRQKGKYLYYDCADKIYSFPLPRTCYENPINARIADELVWQKVSQLMASPELLASQLERWLKARNSKVQSVVGDTVGMHKQIESLRVKEERYNKAYGAGVFTIEQLKEYVAPIREQVASLELQIKKSKEEAGRVGINSVPTQEQMASFAKKAQETLSDLSFEQKRVIVLNTIEKIVGSQKQLQVFGYIPLNYSYGGFKTEDRNCRFAKRGKVHAF